MGAGRLVTTYAPVAVTAAGYAVGSGLGASTWLSAGSPWLLGH